MPMLKLKDIIDKMEQIEDSTEFDGWDAWIELKDWFVKQKPPEADGLANWDDAEQSAQVDVCLLGGEHEFHTMSNGEYTKVVCGKCGKRR